MRRTRLRVVPASDGVSKSPSVSPDQGTDKQIYLLPEEYRRPRIRQSGRDREAVLSVELKRLQDEVKRLESLIAFKNGVLLYAVAYFEDVLADNNPQSVEGLRRMVSLLKGAVARIQGGLD